MTYKKYNRLLNFLNITFPIVYFLIIYGLSELTIKRTISTDNIITFVFLSIILYDILKQISKHIKKKLNKEYLESVSNK